MRERLHELLAEWNPQRGDESPDVGGYRDHVLEVDPNDPGWWIALRQLKQEVDAAPGMGGNTRRTYTPAEKKRFRLDMIGVRTLLEGLAQGLEDDTYRYDADCGIVRWDVEG